MAREKQDVANETTSLTPSQVRLLEERLRTERVRVDEQPWARRSVAYEEEQERIQKGFTRA